MQLSHNGITIKLVAAMCPSKQFSALASSSEPGAMGFVAAAGIPAAEPCFTTAIWVACAADGTALAWAACPCSNLAARDGTGLIHCAK